MISGAVRWSKFAGMGLTASAITGEDIEDPTIKQMSPHLYVAQYGIFGDMADLVIDATEMKDVQDAARAAQRQVPVLGLMHDYAGMAIPETVKKKRLEAIQGAVPLGNTQLGEMFFLAMEQMTGED